MSVPGYYYSLGGQERALLDPMCWVLNEAPATHTDPGQIVPKSEGLWMG